MSCAPTQLVSVAGCISADLADERRLPALHLLFTPAQFYGIAGSNQIWCAVSPAGRGQWKVRDERARHFLNDLVVAAMGLNGACVIALQGNTARNAREGRIIKTSATDRLLMPFFFL